MLKDECEIMASLCVKAGYHSGNSLFPCTWDKKTLIEIAAACFLHCQPTSTSLKMDKEKEKLPWLTIQKHAVKAIPQSLSESSLLF
jgi:hypothetical protein